MKIYKLTDAGKTLAKNGSGNPEKQKVIDYLKEYRSATDDQLDTVAERWVVRSLVDDHILKVTNQ